MKKMSGRDTNPSMTTSAQRDGLALGLYWMVTMGMFICQFAVPVCGLIWSFMMLYTPFFVGGFTTRYALRERSGQLSYAGAYFYSLITYICGALILSLAFWIYLRYMDDGYVIDRYTSVLTDPRNQEIIKGLGYDESTMKQAFDQATTALRSMRPIDITLQFLWSTLVASGLISLISALHCKAVLYFRRRNER